MESDQKLRGVIFLRNHSDVAVLRFTIIGLHSVIVQTHSTSDKAFASL